MKKWECTICGYIHEGEEPPEECPLCGADASQFVEVKERADATASPAQEGAAAQTAASQPVSAAPAGTPSFPQTTIQALIAKHHLHPIAVHTPNGIIPMAVLFVLLLSLFGSSAFHALCAVHRL